MEPEYKIHAVLRIDPYDNIIYNGVHEDDLPDHIEYNKAYRGNCMIFVDGNLEYMPDTNIDSMGRAWMFMEKNEKMLKLRPQRVTKPYL